jgi:hypothetical protein
MNWVRKILPAKATHGDGILIGVDLNSTSVRGQRGPAPMKPRPLTFDAASEELPMILSLQGRRPEAGQAGTAICRLSPHLTCLDFIANLGETREWTAGRHRLDAAQATSVVFDQLQSACSDAAEIVLSVPGYLSRAQITMITQLASKAKLKLAGSISAPLAYGLAAHALDPWTGPALLVDVDDHALSAATLTTDGTRVWVNAMHKWPQFNFRIWKGRILDAIADRCVRQSRRDPRDSAAAEQSLYEQIGQKLHRWDEGKFVEMLIQTSHWFHNMLLRPDDFLAFCERLVSQSLEQIRTFVGGTPSGESLRRMYLTYPADRLPGLATALGKMIQSMTPADPPREFVEGAADPDANTATVQSLAPDAAAQSAHQVAVRIQRNELPRAHFELTVPLPGTGREAAESGQRNLRIVTTDS